MFENKKIKVPAIGDEVYATRIIASWCNVGGNIYSYFTLNGVEEIDAFDEWCHHLGIEDDDISYLRNIWMTGKLELEMAARRYRKELGVLDE